MNEHTNGGAGNQAAGKRTITLTLDPVTMQVSLGGDEMPLSAAMMICDEGLRVLGEMRREAAALMLREKLAALQQDAAVRQKLKL